ncbi:hypothetical protein Tco_1264440 [Tanacetum coccineum]
MHKAHDGQSQLLCNFVEKFLGTVHFGNDQFAPILGYGDLNQGNITIKRVYHVEGLNHNLFSVGQFCDADLEVAFRKSTCFVRDLQGNDLLTDMAPLPTRDQRHPFLRYQGLEYSDRDIADFEERLERIHDKGTHRVQVLDFEGMPELIRDVLYARMRMEHRDGDGVVVFTSQAWGRVFETRGPLVRELILEFLSTLRFREVLLDLDTHSTI